MKEKIIFLRKSVTLKLLALLCLLTLGSPNFSNADSNPTTRKNCRGEARYKVKANVKRIIYKKKNGKWKKDRHEGPNRDDDKGCGFAEAKAEFWDFDTGTRKAYVHHRIGSGAYADKYTPNEEVNGILYCYTGGVAFAEPFEMYAQSNPIANSSSTLTSDITFTTLSPTSARVTINNFQKNLSNSRGDSLRGSSCQIFIWEATDEMDSVMTPEKVKRTGSVVFQNSIISATGILSPFDFFYSDSTVNGSPFNQEYCSPITNLSKSFIISSISDSGNNLRVSFANNEGIGTFDPTAVFNSNIISTRIRLIIEGLYNLSLNNLNMRDTVRAYLRSTTAPYSLVDSATSVIDSTDFTGKFDFKNAPEGNYYILIKHRNSLETWSKSGGENFVMGDIGSYNFSFDQTKAYGENLKLLIDSNYCIYSGDVNQDETIDLSDLNSIYNDGISFATGYLSTDLTGDGIADLSDLNIAYNNSNGFVTVIRP